MRIHDLEAIRRQVRLHPRVRDAQWVFDGLRDTGAVLDGHFALQGGQHSGMFLRFRDFGCRPKLAARAASALLEDLEGPRMPAVNVICPESAGYLLGEAVCDAFVEGGGTAHLVVARLNLSRQPVALPRRGTVDGDLPSIVVNDVATTGRSLRPLFEIAASVGSRVVAALHFAVSDPERIRQALGADVASHWLVSLEWPRFLAGSECPGCRDERELMPAVELN